jgi:hypothetical protein
VRGTNGEDDGVGEVDALEEGLLVWILVLQLREGRWER